MDDAIIEARGLTRYFGGHCAVQDVGFVVPRGCVLGFLGRNGSGKTTTLRMLLGLLEPTRGTGTLLGCDVRRLDPETRRRVGYLPEGHPVFEWMRVEECGRFEAGFHSDWDPRIFAAVLDHFGIARRARARTLSRGQRAGLCLASTLSKRPEVLVLDDPAMGLDPVARRSLVEAMVHFTRVEGRTILFSSHLLADVERVADRIVILDRGVVRADCSLDAFRAGVRQVVIGDENAAADLPEIPGLISTVRREDHIVLTVAGSNGQTESLLRSAGIERFETVEIGLEDALIEYLGERGRKSFLLEDAGGES